MTNFLPAPVATPAARLSLSGADVGLNPVERALLAVIDGRRNMVELESVARALHLGPDALAHLQARGLIVFGDRSGDGVRNTPRAADPG